MYEWWRGTFTRGQGEACLREEVGVSIWGEGSMAESWESRGGGPERGWLGNVRYPGGGGGGGVKKKRGMAGMDVNVKWGKKTRRV